MPSPVPHGWCKFVYDHENRVFEIEDDFNMRPCGKLDGVVAKGSIGRVSFHPRKELAAFTTEGGMAVSDFCGNRLWEYEAPVAALLFSRSGDEIWIAENIDKEKLLVSVVDAESGMENSANTMEDSLYESSLSLCHAPQTVLLELAAGQDGCEIWELDDTNAAMSRRVVFPDYWHIMPAFHPDGKRLLTLENSELLFYSYTWPDAAIVAKQREFTEAEREGDETYPGYSIVYLKNGLAIVQSCTDRLYLFDPKKMERLEELVIEGVEPVQVFTRFGDVLAATTNRNVKNQAIALFAEDELIKLI